MAWDNYRGGGASRSQDNRWGRDSWNEDSGNQWGRDTWQEDSGNQRGQDSGNQWGQDAWQEESWSGSRWEGGHNRQQAQSQSQAPADPWATYNANQAEAADPWSRSQGNRNRDEEPPWRQDKSWEQEESWGAHDQRSNGHRSNQRGRAQDWGSAGSRSNRQDDWQEDSRNRGHQEQSWGRGQRQDGHSRQRNGNSQDDPWSNYQGSRHEDAGQQREDWSSSWNRGHDQQDRRQRDDWNQAGDWGGQQDAGNNWDSHETEDTGGGDGWSRFNKQRSQESSSSSGPWNRRNRDNRDSSSWQQSSSWDQDQGQGDSSWGGDRSGAQQDQGWGDQGWGGGGGSKASEWDGVNTWATTLIEEGDVDWSQRPEVQIKKDFYQDFVSSVARDRPADEVEAMRQNCGIEILAGNSEDHPVPALIENFNEASWPDEVLQALQDDFEGPTPIQKQVWSVALQGRDLVGIAETGSGKTVSYVLPMMAHITEQDHLVPGDGPVGLVLAPTRELAKQIQRVCELFSSTQGLKTSTIVGGTPGKEQQQMLKECIHILVATPGRFLQALGDGWTQLNRCTFVVLDEADELLKKEGFGYDIRAILTQVRKERQVLMFSATWPQEVQDLAHEICTASEEGRPPVHVRIGGTRLAACRNIVQHAEIVESDDAKYERLKEKLLEMKVFSSADKCIIFCRSRNGVQELYDKLGAEEMCWNDDNDHLVERLHGEMRQFERDWAMQEFRAKEGKLRCVIATGVLARGHDIPEVKYVINYDMPKMAEDYIHRVGRTGRAGHTGYAFTFVNRGQWQDLQRGHEYLLDILRATQQEIDGTLQEAIDNHVSSSAEWKQDAWEDAGDWNAGAGSVPAEGFVAYLEEFDESLHNATAVETARNLAGTYAPVGEHHGCPTYEGVFAGEKSFLYFYDSRDGDENAGWYFAPEVGSDMAAASQVRAWACGNSDSPPCEGWRMGAGTEVFPPLKLRAAGQAAVWDESWQATAQTSTEAYREAAEDGACAAQEASGQTSTEAYSATAAANGVTKARSTLNANAAEFKMQEQAYLASNPEGFWQGDLPGNLDDEAAWTQDFVSEYYPDNAFYDPTAVDAAEVPDSAVDDSTEVGAAQAQAALTEGAAPMEVNGAIRPAPGLVPAPGLAPGFPFPPEDYESPASDDHLQSPAADNSAPLQVVTEVEPFVLARDDVGQVPEPTDAAVDAPAEVAAAGPENKDLNKDDRAQWTNFWVGNDGQKDQTEAACSVSSMDLNPKNKIQQAPDALGTGLVDPEAEDPEDLVSECPPEEAVQVEENPEAKQQRLLDGMLVSTMDAPAEPTLLPEQKEDDEVIGLEAGQVAEQGTDMPEVFQAEAQAFEQPAQATTEPRESSRPTPVEEAAAEEPERKGRWRASQQPDDEDEMPESLKATKPCVETITEQPEEPISQPLVPELAAAAAPEQAYDFEFEERSDPADVEQDKPEASKSADESSQGP